MYEAVKLPASSAGGSDQIIKMKGIELKGIPTYLDMQATTPLDPRVLDRMLPYWTTNYGNPHSRTHLFGWESEDAVEVARAQVASLVGTFQPLRRCIHLFLHTARSVPPRQPVSSSIAVAQCSRRQAQLTLNIA